jgi:hypothetical protein
LPILCPPNFSPKKGPAVHADLYSLNSPNAQAEGQEFADKLVRDVNANVEAGPTSRQM